MTRAALRSAARWTVALVTIAGCNKPGQGLPSPLASSAVAPSAAPALSPVNASPVDASPSTSASPRRAPPDANVEPFLVDSETGPMVRFQQRRTVLVPALLTHEKGVSEWSTWEAVAEPFDLDVREVTVASYARCVSAHVCSPAGTSALCNGSDPQRGDHPINCVDAARAAAYCAFVKMRLPTHEEWQNAAKYPDIMGYPSERHGTVNPREHQSEACWGRSRKEGTCPVGSYPGARTPAGFDDLFGNVREWSSTEYCDGGPLLTGCRPGSRFVCGGSYYGPVFQCEAVDQADAEPGDGIRCARDVP